MKHNQRLRILHTCFSASWGGLEIQAVDEAFLMTQKGHKVTIACVPNTRLFQEAADKQLNVLPLKIAGYFHPQAIWKLRQFLHRSEIDLVHSQLSKDIATVVPALKLCRRDIPLVLSRRMGSGVSKKDLFHRITYSRVSRVLAISSVIKENVAQTTSVPPARIITIHHGIDTVQFSPDQGNRAALRKQLGIPETNIVIGLVGRFSPGKGHEEFLEAASNLNARFSNLHFLIVGEASRGEEAYEAAIKAMSVSLRLEQAVIFTGFRNDIPQIMSVLDVFAFPSHAEAFGAVLIEAMAMTLPVVASKSDGVLDIVVEGETGLLVPPKNSNALAEGLVHLISNPDLRQRMGLAGRTRVERMFSRETLGEQLTQVYETVLQEKSLR